jgi:hypothetical protein
VVDIHPLVCSFNDFVPFISLVLVLLGAPAYFGRGRINRGSRRARRVQRIEKWPWTRRILGKSAPSVVLIAALALLAFVGVFRSVVPRLPPELEPIGTLGLLLVAIVGVVAFSIVASGAEIALWVLAGAHWMAGRRKFGRALYVANVALLVCSIAAALGLRLLNLAC